MSLADLLHNSNNSLKQELSEERLKEQLEPLRSLVSFYREYPDIFIDVFTALDKFPLSVLRKSLMDSAFSNSLIKFPSES
jgi:hypothetical protein